jgi:basic membrane protein A and related proteins
MNMWEFFGHIFDRLWNSGYKIFVITIIIVILIGGSFWGYIKIFGTPIFNNNSSSQTVNDTDSIKVVAIFQTPISEPWDGAIHKAIQEVIKNNKLLIDYEYKDSISSPEDRYQLANSYAHKGYKLIICDAYGAESELRRAAKENTKTYFLLGSGLGPTEPNVAVFDNWILESSYLAGMWAGALTTENKIGIVAAMPVPEVNRLVNAFVLGALKINPKVVPYIEYINHWYKPESASKVTRDLMHKGVDVFYSERHGVITVCKDSCLPVFGNINDQSGEASVVVASVYWNMGPTIAHVFNLVRYNSFSAEDFAEWSMLYKGGTRLVPDVISERWSDKCKEDDVAIIRKTKNDIINGELRVPIVEINMQPYFNTDR